MRGILATLALAAAALAAAFGWLAPQARAQAPEIELYMLDCGRMELHRLDLFSDTGDYKPTDQKSILVPCFLVKHPDGILLWDSGLPDTLKENPEAGKSPFFTSVVEKTLVGALSELDLAPADVTHFAMSHLHFDHAGNANLFMASKLLIQNAEYEAGFGTLLPLGFDPATYSELKDADRLPLQGDHDVFGDGSVVVLSTPGHTPGHQCLLVNLQETGPIILSGDLFHLVANRKNARVPGFNTSRAETLASMDRIEKLAANLKARVVIQHDPDDHSGIPMSPQFLQ